MKNNKGFTLIEVIVVIAIIAFIAGIFTVNMTRTLQSLDDSEQDRLTSDVELAADAYINGNRRLISTCNNKTIIFTNDLISAGYLKQSAGTNYPTSVSVCKDSNGILRFS